MLFPGYKNFFSGNTLDRQSHLRSKLDQLLKERAKKSRTIVFNGNKFLIDSLRKPDVKILWLDQNALQKQLELVSNNVDEKKQPILVYLGKDSNFSISYWAMDISTCPSLLQLYNNDAATSTSFEEPRPTSFLLSEFESGVFAQASALLDFNRRIAFCAGCGSITKMAEAGWKRECTNTQNCSSHKRTENYSYIRTDSVAIVNVESPDGNSILLGRQKSWPLKRYSCVAGFLEPGESLEEGAQREVLEETGIRISNCTFHSSQPWPFPSQLMLGVLAKADSTEIDTTSRDMELEDAKWFSREEILSALADKNPNLKLPPNYAIAHSLIKSWALS